MDLSPDLILPLLQLLSPHELAGLSCCSRAWNNRVNNNQDRLLIPFRCKMQLLLHERWNMVRVQDILTLDQDSPIEEVGERYFLSPNQELDYPDNWFQRYATLCFLTQLSLKIEYQGESYICYNYVFLNKPVIVLTSGSGFVIQPHYSLIVDNREDRCTIRRQDSYIGSIGGRIIVEQIIKPTLEQINQHLYIKGAILINKEQTVPSELVRNNPYFIIYQK